MRHLAADLVQIPGVVAVALGGSRATGTATAASDWDFGLYYRGDVDTDAIRRLGWPGSVFEPGDWGRIVNGGAWLQVDGERVDLIYRDLDEVSRWTSEANLGQTVLAAAQARLASAGEWALNEKGIVERAGLGEANVAVAQLDPPAAIAEIARLLDVGWA